MKRLIVAVLVAACVLTVGAYVKDRLVSLMKSPFPRCADDDRQLGSHLVALSILDAHPVGATPYGKRLGGCDDDDRLAYAEQSYRLSASRADVPAFYREAAIKDGWRSAPVPEEGAGMTLVCLTRVISGRNVFLSMSYSDGKGGDEYLLQVRSGPSGSNLCW